MVSGADDVRDRHRRFREIFDREFDYVWLSLRRLGVADRELEDVAQELFVQLHHRLEDYDPARPIRPWLFAFAMRCASNWRRSARTQREVIVDAIEAPSPSPGPEEQLQRAEDLDVVYRALQLVPMDRRAVFILYEFDGCPMKEIAASLQVPLFTAYSRLRVAREEFSTAVRGLVSQRGAR
jgi:RNA polymerase sigma-70 factor (ECF subfamily)